MALTTTADKIRVLGGILKRIGNFDMDTFEGRLVLQKTIYFLQVFKIYLGYCFSLYIHGPYSPELANDGFKLKNKFEEMKQIEFTNVKDEKKFDDFIKFLGEKKDDAKWLETLSTLHLFNKLFKPKSKGELMKLVKKKKFYLDSETCEKAWKHLKKFGLI